MNVAPPLPRFDATNGVFLNAIIRSNFTLKPRIGTNSQHLRFGQFSRSASLPSVGGAMFNAIQLIVARSIPSQVFKPIVKRIAIVVASLHARWAWANKSLQHRFVRVNNANFVVTPKPNKRPTFLPVMRIRLNFARTHITNTSSIRNLVQPLITNYRFPNFHTSSHLAHMGMLP